MDSRRVSLPVSLAVSRHYTPVTPPPAMLLSPNFSSPSTCCHRRSLPSTPLPNGGRRSLPPTPPTPMSEMDELVINDSPDDVELRVPRDRLRSFDLRDGQLLDRGFQRKPRSQEGSANELIVCQEPRDTRRATCPDIFLFDTQNTLMRHVVLRIYGSRNCGKKSLANRIHHFATSMGPEKVDPDENGNDYTKTTTFLLNGKEVTLEIVLESALEVNSPFQQAKTIYIAMYNVDSRASFQYATEILERMTASANRASPNTSSIDTFLIGNKIDLKRNEVISTAEGRHVAKNFKCEFLETSALLGLNTEDAWTAILQQLQEPSERRRPSWVERLLNRGKGVAKSAEEALHRIIT